MFDAALRPLIDPPLDRLAGAVDRLGIGANAITVGGFIVGVAAAVLVALDQHLLALAGLLANRALDGLDGAVARRRGITDFGGYLDIVLDFLFYAGFVFAFAVADPGRNALAAAFLILAFVGTGSSFLAFAIMAARRGIETSARGKKSLYYLGGLTEGTETIGVFVLFCLLPAWFAAIAVLFGILCCLTTVSRILEARRTLE
ncbi:MAG: CDP-alcohol phosphatidyltransferase family protein [Geminicoccaceae bacterium]